MGLYIKQNGVIKPLAGSTPGEGLPVGAITAFTANNIPSGWLLCDGSTFDETLYPALFIALGGNVLPDLRNRFLEGADSVVREFKEAGLPNITGVFGGAEGSPESSGAFKRESGGECPSTAYQSRGKVLFDAKSGETKTDGTLKTEDEAHVYGNSDTVQPASYTVNYIIKATSGITTEAALDAFNMIKEYERKQNLLSDIETISTTANANNTAEWDGYLMINLTRSVVTSGSTRKILVNGILFTPGINGIDGQVAGETITIPLKKGDVWSIDYITETSIRARWYKERDYEGR